MADKTTFKRGDLVKFDTVGGGRTVKRTGKVVSGAVTRGRISVKCDAGVDYRPFASQVRAA